MLNHDGIDNIYNSIKKISKISTIIGGILLFIMSGLIGVEVIIRKFFSLSLSGVEEFSGYTLAIISIWAFSFTFLQKGHIRIDILYQKLSQSFRHALDLMSVLMIIIFVYPMTYFSYKTLYMSIIRSSKANTTLQTPLWIPQLFWFLGTAFFAITATVVLAKLIKHLLKKDFQAATALSGCTTIDEEIEEEIR